MVDLQRACGGVVVVVVVGGDGYGLCGAPEGGVGRGAEGEGLLVAGGAPVLVDLEAFGCGDGDRDVGGRLGGESYVVVPGG